MARALSYQLEFISEVYKHNHLVEIWEEGYIGPVTKLRMGPSGLISKRDRDGGVYGTSIELKLESTLDSQLIKLYTADATKFLVMHYRNNVLVQSGFIVPEQYSEEYIAPPYDIAVLVTDGLGILKEKKYTYYGRHTVLEVLKYCLDSTGLNLDFDIVCDLREAGADPARSVLAQITIDGAKWRDRTIYEALSELSATFRAYITQYNGRWRFARFADLLTDSMIYTNSLSYLISIPNPVRKLGSLNNDLYPIGNLTFQIEPAYKSAKFTRTYDKRVSFFENPDFKMLDNWDVATTASTQMFRDKNYVVLRSLPSGEEISQTIIVEASNRTFNFEISYFKLSLRPLSFTVGLKLTATSGQVQWLGKEGWQGAEERFDMVADAENELETIYNTTSPYNIQTIQQTGTIKFETIPADGELTLYIRAKGPDSVGTDEAARSKFAITDAFLTTEVEKGLTVDAILNSGNIAAGDTEIYFGDSDVGDNVSLILSNFFKRANGQPTAAWKVGPAGAEDSFFNTMVRDYVVYYGLPKRILSGYVMGEHLQIAQCLLDKYADTYMYIDTMTMDVYADQAEVSAYELLPHLEILAVNEDVAPEEFPRVVVSFQTLPDGTRIKTYTVVSSGSAYKRVTSRDKGELTLEEILRIKSRANYSNALAALAQKKADTANLLALEASQSADDALLRLNNIVNNSIVSVEEKAGLVQLIDRLSDEMILYASDSNNKGADITALQDAFTALLDFLSTVVQIANNEAIELTPAQIEQYNALFAEFYAKRSVFTTDVSSIRAELLSYATRISDIDKDKARVIAEYNSTSEAQGLTEALKTTLTDAKNEYLSTHNAYKTLLSAIIADDKITAEERASAGAGFVNYSEKLNAFNVAVETARKSITDGIGTTLASWVADGVISPLEKLAIKQTRAQVLSEKESLIADAGVYDISTTAYVTAWTAYDTALAKYSAEEPEIITVDTDFATSESAYKTAKVALKTAVTNAQKSDTGEKHPKGGSADLDMTVKNLVAVGYVGFYGGVSGGSTPASSLLDLNDIDVTTASAVVGSPLVKLGNGKWGPGSVSIDLTNYFTKAESDARYAFKAHSHDYVTPTAFNAHTADSVKHITSAERSAWNGKESALGNPDTNGKILASTTSGVRSWVSRYVLPVATAAVLGGVMIGANISVNAQGVISVAAPYSHPATHPASMITESTTRRFITDTERVNWNDSYDKRHTHGNKANLDTINQNLSQTSNVKFNDIIADGSIAFYGGVGSGSTPVASLLDLSDIDASISTAATGTPLVKLSNGKWGAGSISIDLSNYYNKSDSDARYAFKSHSHDYVTTSVFNGHTHTFASLTSKPTTLSGYGITDAIKVTTSVNDILSVNGNTSFISTYLAANTPSSTCLSGFQILIDNNSNYKKILGFDYSGKIWANSQVGGSWSGWREIWTSANLLNIGTTASSARAALGLGSMATETASNYLLKSGGILTGKVFSASMGADVYGGAFEIRERGNVGGTQTEWSYSPAITFHWGGRYAHRFGLRSDGQFAIDDTNILIHSGNIGSQSVNYAESASRLRSVGYATSIDLNTHLAGGGIVGNYGSVSYWVNGPSGMSYGSVIQFDQAQSTSILSLQLAFDVNHNSTISTKDLWFRTSNNLGFQADWRRVFHSGNSNLTTIDWSAKNLTLAGSITGATTITASSTIQATTAKLTNLTDGYIPCHISDASGLGNSNIWQALDGSGHVGLGTTSAWARLSISNTGSDSIPFFGVNTVTYGWNFYLRQSDGNLLVKANNNSVLTDVLSFKRTNGNIGIGYTDRTEKFAVNGGGYFNGALTIAGALSGVTTLSASSVANVGGFRVTGNVIVGNGVGLEIYYNNTNQAIYFQNYHRGVDNAYHKIYFGASEYSFDTGLVKITNTTQSTAYTNGALVLSGGLGIAKDLYSNGKAVFASYIQGAYYKLGNWEIKQNASEELEFILSGSLKFKITSTGIVSSGGVAFYS